MKLTSSIDDAETERLATADRWTYRAGRESAAEPAAWSAVALAAHGAVDAARRPADWLATLQQKDGSVGVSAAQREPRWPTALALIAWSAVDRAARTDRYRARIDAAVAWSLNDQGKTAPRSPEIGHDTTIVGWSWAANTASWFEPTCWYVLGLTAAGQSQHPRVCEGRRLIADRLLPGGGANYGNTIVLGQALLPHVAPTGLAMVTLSDSANGDDRIRRSLDYLERAVGSSTSPASLSWACMGLTAHGRRPELADAWIADAFSQPAWEPLASYERALLLLALDRAAFLSR